MILAMFEHKDASGSYHVTTDDKVGKGRELLQSVWRVGKNEIKLFAACLYETEDIAAELLYICCHQVLRDIV